MCCVLYHVIAIHIKVTGGYENIRDIASEIIEQKLKKGILIFNPSRIELIYLH